MESGANSSENQLIFNNDFQKNIQINERKSSNVGNKQFKIEARDIFLKNFLSNEVENQ